MGFLKMEFCSNRLVEHNNNGFYIIKDSLSKDEKSKIRGSISIEASLVFPITLVIIMVFITVVLALHDSVCILGAGNSGMDSIILEKEGINYEKRIMDGLYYQDENEEFLYTALKNWFNNKTEYKNLLTAIGGTDISAIANEYIFFEKHRANITRGIKLEILGDKSIGESIERIYFNPADAVRTIEFVVQKASFKKILDKVKKQKP